MFFNFREVIFINQSIHIFVIKFYFYNCVFIAIVRYV